MRMTAENIIQFAPFYTRASVTKQMAESYVIFRIANRGEETHAVFFSSVFLLPLNMKGKDNVKR